MTESSAMPWVGKGEKAVGVGPCSCFTSSEAVQGEHMFG